MKRWAEKKNKKKVFCKVAEKNTSKKDVKKFQKTM